MKIISTIFLLTNCLIVAAQVFPTNAQVFNFTVGDTFVYRVANISQDTDFEMMVVTARFDSGDATKYTLQHHFNYHNIQGYLNSNTVQQIIRNDSSVVDCHNAYYSMADDCFCNWGGISGPYYDPTPWSDSTLAFEGECYNAGGGSYSVLALEGLGVVYINSYCVSGGTPVQEKQYCNLVYYHLANGLIGGLTNYYILGLPVLFNNEVSVQLAPNPAYNQFEVKIESPLPPQANFKLFDALGNVLLNQQINSTHKTIQRQNIANGIYFWHIDIDGQTQKAGKLILD